MSVYNKWFWTTVQCLSSNWLRHSMRSKKPKLVIISSTSCWWKVGWSISELKTLGTLPDFPSAGGWGDNEWAALRINHLPTQGRAAVRSITTRTAFTWRPEEWRKPCLLWWVNLRVLTQTGGFPVLVRFDLADQSFFRIVFLGLLSHFSLVRCV